MEVVDIADINHIKINNSVYDISDENIDKLKDANGDLDQALVYRGEVTSDLDNYHTTTGAYQAGIYKINGRDIFGEGRVRYGALVLLPVFDTQIVLYGGGRWQPEIIQAPQPHGIRGNISVIDIGG